MKRKYLDIILLEDISFTEMVEKLEKAFKIPFPYENRKGRLRANAQANNYDLILDDKYDDLDKVLCDDHYLLKIYIEAEIYDKVEEDIIEKLKKGGIKWKKGVWIPLKPGSPIRIIYPDKEAEMIWD